MEHPASFSQQLFGWSYVVVLIAMGVTYYLVFYRGQDAARKRRWWPRFVIAAALVVPAYLAVFILQAQPPKPGYDPHLEFPLIVLLVLTVGFVFLKIKTTRFCDKCGAIVQRRLFTSVDFCPKCGAELEKTASKSLQ